MDKKGKGVVIYIYVSSNTPLFLNGGGGLPLFMFIYIYINYALQLIIAHCYIGIQTVCKGGCYEKNGCQEAITLISAKLPNLTYFCSFSLIGLPIFYFS